jgi:RNA polymerase sigma-70 factor (ECF subfamily)
LEYSASAIRQQLTDFILAGQTDFYRLAYSYVKNQDAALDVVQESIVRALSKVSALRQPSSMKAWFYRILLNESMNYYRHNSRLVCLDAAFSQQAAPIRDEAARLDLYAAIERLTPNEQAVVRLRFFQDMTLEEISKATGTNLNTVKSRLYKALNKLRDLTGEEILYE